MPTIILDRIPLPNLKIYTSLSVLLVSFCVYFAVNSTKDPDWRLLLNSTSVDGYVDAKLMDDESLIKLTNGELHSELSDVIDRNVYMNILADATPLHGNQTRSLGGQVKDVMDFMFQEPVCVWTLINMAYCCLILLGKSIQKVVFGELRISEQQHLKDKFWNFVFYKFIFVFGVVNVQFLHEVVLWVSWFSILGFLHLLSQLCKDRFEYLSFSPTTPGWSHVRLVGLLSSILTISGFMFIICICVGFFGGMNTFAFMAAECVLLTIRTLHVLIRYGMFLYDMRQGGMSAEVSWDKRGPVAYHIELLFEAAALLIDLMHHLHMLLWSNIFLSMASLVIVMQLRYLSHEIQRKYRKHRNYLWVLNHMEKSYPLATADDLTQNSDNCAICWEKMETARKLPCSHLFHNSCLQSWLEQDTSCPTCRLGLSVQPHVSHAHPNIDRIDEPENTGRATNNHFFHFNGSRYVSWLPNFSVEVTHINTVLRTNPLTTQTAAHTSQLRNMARQVQQMFPHYPTTIIIADLQLSRSMEVTIDNILEGRLQIPARFQNFNDEDDFGETSQNGRADGASTSGTSAPNEYSVRSDVSTGSSSSDSGYEIERNSNIFGNQNELLRDESSEDIPLGDRFSKSSAEREKILQRRKEMLLAIARKRYLEKSKSELNMPTSDTVHHHRNKTSMQNDE
ncbi:E3 ubiquitin-protein ligase AMFR-like isoform X2 [Bradysia coprophila]|uniref:E3 ubiquitin-protein ligase AMFR-like isoform X2 n=1 Tax=Bradysia coprophila TaxID=38358 RepID=UPI00187D82E3|nr:E3 ubiquitin-protein ligase AMFR-like isoform X2 [Bradysia coprophila]